jgi:hypothetical protein
MQLIHTVITNRPQSAANSILPRAIEANFSGLLELPALSVIADRAGDAFPFGERHRRKQTPLHEHKRMPVVAPTNAGTRTLRGLPRRQ